MKELPPDSLFCAPECLYLIYCKGSERYNEGNNSLNDTANNSDSPDAADSPKIKLPFRQVNRWIYLRAARALASTQSHYFVMQKDEVLSSHAAFVENGTISEIEMDLEEGHPFSWKIQRETPTELQKVELRVAKTSCLRAMVQFLVSMHIYRAVWKMLKGTMDQIMLLEANENKQVLETLILEQISNALYVVAELHQKIKKYVDDYIKQFPNGDIPYSSRAVEYEMCIAVILREWKVKLHMHIILRKIKDAYFDFPEQRQMIPLSLMSVIDVFFDLYQFLECVILFALTFDFE
ncbi:hypothetical protein HK098_006896 [Nowakowskiella sp. JEL0407]|nr:hypothetical protein HK098_006896 [Nowakowskiella sp. JEL0407]